LDADFWDLAGWSDVECIDRSDQWNSDGNSECNHVDIQSCRFEYTGSDGKREPHPDHNELDNYDVVVAGGTSRNALFADTRCDGWNGSIYVGAYLGNLAKGSDIEYIDRSD
jgi:hypothetical protein